MRFDYKRGYKMKLIKLNNKFLVKQLKEGITKKHIVTKIM